jgi:hypothetical protein
LVECERPDRRLALEGKRTTQEDVMHAAAARIAAALLAASLAAPALGAEVDRREANQQHRIAAGIESGQLTPREAARLERGEARIDRQVRRERAENGGKLTPAERRQVNREQNRMSHRIYREKHDAQHR